MWLLLFRAPNRGEQTSGFWPTSHNTTHKHKDTLTLKHERRSKSNSEVERKKKDVTTVLCVLTAVGEESVEMLVSKAQWSLSGGPDSPLIGMRQWAAGSCNPEHDRPGEERDMNIFQ